MIKKIAKKESQLNLNSLLEEYPFIKQIMQNILQVVWIRDLRTDQILYVSPAFETIWGLSCESLYADPFTLIKSIHPEDRVNVLSAIVNDHHPSVSQSFRILRPDGSLRWISNLMFMVLDHSSNIHYQVNVAQDISNQNYLDQSLRKALNHSREQFSISRRMSLASKPEAVLKTLMLSSELRPANLAYIVFFGSPPAKSSHEIEILASWFSGQKNAASTTKDPINVTSLVDDFAAADLLHPTKPVILTEISKDQRLTPEIRDLLREAEIRTAVIFPLIALGNWLGCLLVFFSKELIFEPVALRQIKVLVDQAAITLYNLHLLVIEAESRHEAERANEIKTEFLAMITHELRTPLTSIIGFTTTLLADDVIWDKDEQRDFIKTIHHESHRLQELIDHLLDLSRLEAGMLPISLGFYSLQEIIEDAMPQLQILTIDHIFTAHLPNDLPKILVDEKRIAQVLVNLVRNAATYAPKGTEITISTTLRGTFIQVNVIDQGPGILSSEHKKVFKAFQRGVNIENGVLQGAGLGLAICKGLVEAHGGRIWIKRKSPPGATISFTIPLAPEHLSVLSSELVK